jgi:hypothetical protein
MIYYIISVWYTKLFFLCNINIFIFCLHLLVQESRISISLYQLYHHLFILVWQRNPINNMDFYIYLIIYIKKIINFEEFIRKNKYFKRKRNFIMYSAKRAKIFFLIFNKLHEDDLVSNFFFLNLILLLTTRMVQNFDCFTFSILILNINFKKLIDIFF